MIDNPILNSPFTEPKRHFEFDDRGVITGTIANGRRRSLYFTPIPGTKKKGAPQSSLDFDTTDRVGENQFINQVRIEVSLWRDRGYPGTTQTTRRLLTHWNQIDEPDRPLFFCQREAIETAIFLAEVAPKSAPYFHSMLAQYANSLNEGLFRVALKMATGAGKTVVMSLLIAWQTLNKARNPRDGRFTDQFLVVAPGITIKDRLRVLKPAEAGNYYQDLDLIPTGLGADLNRATVHIINFHQLMRREKRTATAKTKKLLGNDAIFTESPGEMANRVLQPFSGTKQIIILNDEGHHCYQQKPANVQLDPDAAKSAFGLDDLAGEDKAAAKAREDEARVWHTGLVHIARKRGIKFVYDLSATPFYLRGSGWQEATLFQWVVSDFALTDAIECGIVKIPRVPTADDVDSSDPAFRALWAKVGQQLPKGTKHSKISYPPVLPPELETALWSLYDDYEKHFNDWQEAQGHNPEAVPPVFIVVAQNTNISQLVHEWMSGWEETKNDGSTLRHPGKLPLFNNVDNDGECIPRPVAMIVDSKAIDSGNQLTPAFLTAAAAELEQFRVEFERRTPGQSTAAVGEEGLLREVMNTVGRAGKLGAPIRAVTSVSMLTEGWDARTVTHILGIRAFGTQLLCEQVVGRGLRRVSYELNDKGRFDPEYADVYGVPFAFVPVAGQRSTAEGIETHTYVHTVEQRSQSRIEFPRVVGYHYATPSDSIQTTFSDAHRLVLGDDAVPTRVDIEDITGIPKVHTLDALRSLRMQKIRYELAANVCEKLTSDEGDPRPWLFPAVLAAVGTWIDGYVTITGNAFLQLLGLSANQARATDLVLAAITATQTNDAAINAILERANPVGDTSGVGWATRRDPDELWVTDEKCHLSHVVPHSGWETTVAATLEGMNEVVRYVKNDHLDFTIPYVIDGIQRSYLTDFIAVIDDGRPSGPVNLLIEVSGQERPDKKVKVATTRDKWLPAVNSLADHGRWELLEIHDPVHVDTQIRNHLNLTVATP